MNKEQTTVMIQRYHDASQGHTAAEPIVRELLLRAVNRRHLLWAAFLHKSDARLTRPPVNLETGELLGVVKSLTNGLPLLSSRMFPGLMSRWTSPCL